MSKFITAFALTISITFAFALNQANAGGFGTSFHNGGIHHHQSGNKPIFKPQQNFGPGPHFGNPKPQFQVGPHFGQPKPQFQVGPHFGQPKPHFHPQQFQFPTHHHHHHLGNGVIFIHGNTFGAFR